MTTIETAHYWMRLRKTREERRLARAVIAAQRKFLRLHEAASKKGIVSKDYVRRECLGWFHTNGGDDGISKTGSNAL